MAWWLDVRFTTNSSAFCIITSCRIPCGGNSTTRSNHPGAAGATSPGGNISFRSCWLQVGHGSCSLFYLHWKNVPQKFITDRITKYVIMGLWFNCCDCDLLLCSFYQQKMHQIFVSRNAVFFSTALLLVAYFILPFKWSRCPYSSLKLVQQSSVLSYLTQHIWSSHFPVKVCSHCRPTCSAG